MSTNDVPGAVTKNNDTLHMGCWAEHADGSLIFVEAVEGSQVVYSIFDVGVDPPVEYRDAMPEVGFKLQFTWDPKKPQGIKWTWHDKTAFPWDRVMKNFPQGSKAVSAMEQMSAAQRVAESLSLQGQAIADRPEAMSSVAQQSASTIMDRLRNAIGALKKD